MPNEGRSILLDGTGVKKQKAVYENGRERKRKGGMEGVRCYRRKQEEKGFGDERRGRMGGRDGRNKTPFGGGRRQNGSGVGDAVVV